MAFLVAIMNTKFVSNRAQCIETVIKSRNECIRTIRELLTERYGDVVPFVFKALYKPPASHVYLKNGLRYNIETDEKIEVTGVSKETLDVAFSGIVTLS